MPLISQVQFISQAFNDQLVAVYFLPLFLASFGNHFSIQKLAAIFWPNFKIPNLASRSPNTNSNIPICTIPLQSLPNVNQTHPTSQSSPHLTLPISTFYIKLTSPNQPNSSAPKHAWPNSTPTLICLFTFGRFVYVLDKVDLCNLQTTYTKMRPIASSLYS